MSDIVKRLRIKASVISMGENIAWGSDTDLMNEASTIIELLETALKKVSDYNLRLETQIETMKNCFNCQFQTITLNECKTCDALSNWQLRHKEKEE